MTDTPLYRLRHVRKEYGGTPALDVDELGVAAGEILCLVGPTGAGKSTLLRILAGVEPPTSGELLFRGRPLGSDSPLAVRRGMTLVFQRPLLLAGTVRANVEYGLRLRGAQTSAAARVDRILDRLSLTRLAGRSARTLSGGETQLIALARALVLEPDVLLLDEPTANLDPAHVALVEQVIGEDHQRRGTGIVWATHNLFQARRMGRRTALLFDGRLVEAAPTEVFFGAPSDPRTRDFISGKIVY